MYTKNKLFLLIILYISIITSSEARNEEIKLLIKQGTFSKALILAEEHLTKNPDEIRTLFLKGIILANMNRPKKSASIFISLTKKHPELPEPYNNLAVIYAANGEYDKAEEALRNAINTHPSYAVAHQNLGDIYAKMASQAYNKILQLHSNEQEVKKNSPKNLAMIGALNSAPKLTDDKKEIKPDLIVAKLEPRPTTILKPLFDEKATRKAVRISVDRWKNSWSSKDIDNYIKSYSAKFIPPNNLNRSKWQEQRRIRLNQPKYIKISLDNLKINILSKDMASVKFLQIYQSDNYTDRVKKQLTLNKIGETWLISKEESSQVR